MMEISSRSAAIVEWVCVALSLIFVFLRSYVRIAFFRAFTASDYIILFAWILFLGNTVCDVYIERWGEWSDKIHFTKDAYPDFESVIHDEDQIVRLLKLQYGQNLMYYLSIFLVKAAFLLLYFKLFPPGMRKLRVSLYCVAIFTGVGLLVTLLINLLWCQPVSRNWTRIPEERCLAAASQIPYLMTNAFHVFSDFMIYILPFFLLPTLASTATRRSVYVLSAIFSLGLLCIVCTVARLVCVGMATGLPLVGAWSAAEMGIAIIVACSPVLKTGWDVHRAGYTHSDGEPRGLTRLGGDSTMLTGGTLTALGKRSRSSRSRNRDIELGSTANMVDAEALHSPGHERFHHYRTEYVVGGGGIELGGLAPRKQSKPDIPDINSSGPFGAVEPAKETDVQRGSGAPSERHPSPSFMSRESIPLPPAPVISTNPGAANSVSRMMWKKKSAAAVEDDRNSGEKQAPTKKNKSKPKPKLKASPFGLSTFGGEAEHSVRASRASGNFSADANASRESRVGDDWGIEPPESRGSSSTSSGVNLDGPPMGGTRSRSPFGY